MSSFSLAVSKRKIEAEQSRFCKLGVARGFMTTEDKDALDYAIDMARGDSLTPQTKRVFTVAWLTQVLNDNGHPIGKTVVSEHLSRKCACDQSSQ